MMHAPREARIEMTCTEQAQECRLRIRVGHNRSGAQLLATLELDADDDAGLDDNALDRRIRADLRAVRSRSRGERLAHGAHAAARQAECTGYATHGAAATVQEIEHR